MYDMVFEGAIVKVEKRQCKWESCVVNVSGVSVMKYTEFGSMFTIEANDSYCQAIYSTQKY